MKRILTSLAMGLTLMLATVLPVSAAHYWQIKSSEPKATSQTRTFTIDFVTLSAEASDDFTVTLYENDAAKNTATTTKDYGDSGKFTVTVPSDGMYKYYLIAQSSLDGTSRKTPDQNVTVNTQGTTSTVTVVQAPATNSTGGTGASGTTTGTTTGTTGEAAPAIQGASTEAGQGGQVSDSSATNDSTESDEDGDVLGAEKVKDSGNDWVLPTIGTLAALALLYAFVYRAGRWPFRRG